MEISCPFCKAVRIKCLGHTFAPGRVHVENQCQVCHRQFEFWWPPLARAREESFENVRMECEKES